VGNGSVLPGTHRPPESPGSKKASAVANFCSAYLASADNNFLSAGHYAVKHLNYEWSLNGKYKNQQRNKQSNELGTGER